MPLSLVLGLFAINTTHRKITETPTFFEFSHQKYKPRAPSCLPTKPGYIPRRQLVLLRNAVLGGKGPSPQLFRKKTGLLFVGDSYTGGVRAALTTMRRQQKLPVEATNLPPRRRTRAWHATNGTDEMVCKGKFDIEVTEAPLSWAAKETLKGHKHSLR